MRFDRLWLDARLATLHPSRPGLGVIERGAIGACGGRIAFIGPQRDLPANADAAERIRCDGRWITPGLIDCHTHLVFGGHRAHEFELRLAGASYGEIAAAGGGIVSTVKATRAASEDALVAGASRAPRPADRRGRHHGRRSSPVTGSISTPRPACCARRAGSASSGLCRS